MKILTIDTLNSHLLTLKTHNHKPGRVAQSVTCLATDACLTADPWGREFDPGPVPYMK